MPNYILIHTHDYGISVYRFKNQNPNLECHLDHRNHKEHTDMIDILTKERGIEFEPEIGESIDIVPENVEEPPTLSFIPSPKW